MKRVRTPSALFFFAAAAAALAAACSTGGVTSDAGALPAASEDGSALGDAAPDRAVIGPPGPLGPSCANGARDGDEADVDCGGRVCPACANGRACATAADCVSRVCAGGRCTNDAGCADGTREGFASATAFPNIAACAGAWSVPGLGVSTPACGRGAGNSGANPTGKDCSVADLCQVGWRICDTPAAVATKSGGGGCAAAGIGQTAFFAIRQSGGGNAACGPGTNDLFGCGDVGDPPDPATCAPLDRFSNDLCRALPPTWACGANSADEQGSVTKSASTGGGVLCCRD